MLPIEGMAKKQKQIVSNVQFEEENKKMEDEKQREAKASLEPQREESDA